MTGNIHMPNLKFILQTIFDIFSSNKVDDSGYLCDPWQLSDTKLVQP